MKAIFYKIFPLLFTLILLSGCATKALWKENTSYNDKIQSFNLAKDKLILIGRTYHYIFTVNDKLVNLLTLENNSTITFKPQNLEVNKDNSITGSLYIQYDEENYKYLNSLADKPFTDERNFSQEIKGTRYLPKKDFHIQSQFPKAYIIEIQRNWNPDSTSYKILVSPITLTNDIASGIVMAGVAVVAIPFAAIDYIMPNTDKIQHELGLNR